MSSSDGAKKPEGSNIPAWITSFQQDSIPVNRPTPRPVSVPAAASRQSSEPIYRSVSLVKPSARIGRSLYRGPCAPTEKAKQASPSSAAPVSDPRTTRPPSHGFAWVVPDDAVLPPVPSYYPLERTSRTVYGVGSFAGTVADRISEACRVMNVHIADVSVRDDYVGGAFEAPAVAASLVTEERAEIHLSFWGGSEDGCIIVEAQRRGGEAMASHKCIRNVLDAAGGDFDVSEYQKREERERSYAELARQMAASKESKGQPPISDSRRTSLEPLEIVSDLIKKDRVGARQLGMESLLLLTDAVRSRPEITGMASRAILCFGGKKDDNIEELGIGEAVLSLILHGRIDDGDDDETYPEEEKYNKILRSLALSTLANVLESRTWPISSFRVSALLTECEERWPGHDLLSTLLSGLIEAEKNPHDACPSARCLRSLCSTSEEVRQRVQRLGAHQTVLAARNTGRYRMAGLEREAEVLLAVIEK